MKLIIFSSVLILFVFGLMIPNSYGQTDEIIIDVKTESSEYYLHQEILIEGKVSKIIPNTPISFVLYAEDGTHYGSSLHVGPYDNVRPQRSGSISHSDAGEFSRILKFNSFIDEAGQKITVKFFYGYEHDNFASTEITFYLHDENDQIFDKLQNYFPTEKIKLGLDLKSESYDWRKNPLGGETFRGDFAGAMTYQSGGPHNWGLNALSSIRYFENGNYVPPNSSEFLCFGGTMDEPKGHPMCSDMSILNSSNTPTIPEDFKCVKYERSKSPTKPFIVTECRNETLLVKIWEVHRFPYLIKHPELSLLTELILENIEANPITIQNELPIASFVDQTKDPQHYIDRYFSEPTYKKWFDENHPQYSSIYEAVGLEESLIEKINEQEYDPEPTSEGGGCLIATATYGSEMAQEVQQLRELRDNQLLNTESGTSFMESFNDFYYSFSPYIADYERENPVFKEMVKIAITPMITSLSMLNYVEMDSESEVLGYGISLILLNLGMYLGIPAVVIVGIRKRF